MKSSVYLFSAAILLLLTAILASTALDAYQDIGCPATQTDCWPTDWREVTFDIGLMLTALVGGVVCVERGLSSK